jgi:hypothetical protein
MENRGTHQWEIADHFGGCVGQMQLQLEVLFEDLAHPVHPQNGVPRRVADPAGPEA